MRSRVLLTGLKIGESARWHDGRLWLLESGTGQLLMIDPVTGQREPVAEVPGFARGLALCGRYAFVGLSRIRTITAGVSPLQSVPSHRIEAIRTA